MSADQRELEAVVRAAIRGHLRCARHAADTARGVANWWIPWRLGRIPVPLAERVLEQLVAAGELERRMLPDRSLLYRARGTGPE